MNDTLEQTADVTQVFKVTKQYDKVLLTLEAENLEDIYEFLGNQEEIVPEQKTVPQNSSSEGGDTPQKGTEEYADALERATVLKLKESFSGDEYRLQSKNIEYVNFMETAWKELGEVERYDILVTSLCKDTLTLPSGKVVNPHNVLELVEALARE